MSTPARNLARVIAVLILASVLAHVGLMPIAFGFEGEGFLPLAFAVGGLLYFALGAASIVGLWSARPWGLLSFYAHVLLGTFMFGVSLVPFLPSLLPPDAQPRSVFHINLAITVTVGLLHFMAAHKRS